MKSLSNSLHFSKPPISIFEDRLPLTLSIVVQDKKSELVIHIFQKEINLSDSKFDKMMPFERSRYVEDKLQAFHLECIWGILKRMNNEGELFTLKEYTGSRFWENEYIVVMAHINYGIFSYLKRFEDE